MATATASRQGPRQKLEQSAGRIAPRRQRWLPWHTDPAVALATVAVAFLLVQLIEIPLDLGLGWDETVYVSQISGDAPQTIFTPPRARGILFLISPVASQTPSIEILRVYLAILSALALFGSYYLWLKVRRTHAIPLAALLFAGLWLSVFYGPEVMPNIWVAFGAVAATALAVLVSREPRDPKLLIGLALVLAAVALFRPSESVWLAGSLGLSVLWRYRRQLVRATLPLAAILAGTFLGWLQWIVEAEWTYGGFFTRLLASSDANAGSFRLLNWVGDLRAVNGPTGCGFDCRSDISPGEAGFWLALIFGCLAAILIVRQKRRDLAVLVVLPVGVAFALGSTYFFLIANAAPRFLHPVYALVVIPCAVALQQLFAAQRPGLSGLISSRAPRPARRVALRISAKLAACALLVVHLALQQSVLIGAVARTEASRSMVTAVAHELNRLGVRAPCLISGTTAVETAYVAGCRSRNPVPPVNATTPAYIEKALREGKTVAVISRTDAPPSTYVQSWQHHVITGADGKSRTHIWLPR